MLLMTGGISFGILLCAALVHLFALERELESAFHLLTGGTAAHGPSDLRTLSDLFAAVNNPHVSAGEKACALAKIERNQDPKVALMLTLSFAMNHPTALRRRILALISVRDGGAQTGELLSEVLADRTHPLALRLDAAQYLLASGYGKGPYAVEKIVREESEDGHLKASLIDLITPNLNVGHLPVLIASLRVPHMHVRSAVFKAFKRINSAPGVFGGLLREQTIAALALSIQHSQRIDGIRTQLRLLIEAEAACAPNHPSEPTLCILRGCVRLRPLDNRVAEEIAALAAEGIGRLRLRALVPELKRAMYGPSDLVREKAVASLKGLGAENLIPGMGFIANYDLLARIHKAALQSAPLPIPAV